MQVKDTLDSGLGGGIDSSLGSLKGAVQGAGSVRAAAAFAVLTAAPLAPLLGAFIAPVNLRIRFHSAERADKQVMCHAWTFSPEHNMVTVYSTAQGRLITTGVYFGVAQAEEGEK